MDVEPRSATISAPEREPDPRFSPRRVIFGAGAGNALEWYDWSVYAIFAPFFATQFFDSTDALSATLSTLAIFAVGFLMRPLGGMFFGWYADRHGRRNAMVLSMLITAAGSLLIAVSPTYEVIGIAASLVLVVARLGQGFGLGGEIGASHTYLGEAAPPARRGLWSSSMYVAVTTGVLFATIEAAVLTGLLSTEAMGSWGWRIPFAIGALLALWALYLRRGLSETETFTKNRDTKEMTLQDRPRLMQDIWRERANMLRIIGLTCGGTVAYYAWGISAPGYAIAVKGIEPTNALWAGVCAQLVYIIALPIWGAVSDRIGRRPTLMVFALGFIVLSFPLSWLIRDAAWQLGVAMGIALAIHASAAALLPAVFSELFPTRVRAVGMAVPYSIAVALFGGTAPYLQTWLGSRGLSWMFTAYVMVLCAGTLVTVLKMPETRAKELS